MSSPAAPDSSRRTVLATGTAVSGALLTSGLTAQTAAAEPTEAGEATAAEPARDPWHTVLDDADLVWQRMPTAWYEGPFLGNGFLGSGIYAEPGAPSTAVRFNVQHSEVQDHRPEFGSLFGLARLPIGHFTLEPVGAITGLDWRLSLRDAELTGTLTTEKGTLRLRALVHNDRSVLAVEVTPSEGERGFRWVFHPAEAISPRAAFKPLPDGYRGNPPAQVADHDGITAAVQPLLSGGQHVTAWRERSRGRTRTLYAHVAHSYPKTTALGQALKTVRAAAQHPYSALALDHRVWWHAYYRKSFLSVPDARIQRFYWIQLYKTAAAARRDAPVMATSGPWLEPTPWPNTWWNLNAQLEYWLIHGSNHLELDAITRALSEFRDNLAQETPTPYRADSLGIPRTTDPQLVNGAISPLMGYGVGIPGQDPPTPEVGNLTWALHNVWLSYRHTMDESILRDVLFPLLRKAINYYLHFLEPGPDGRLHLPATFSPEYGGDSRDCNYDLMLLTWGCRTLVESAELLGIDDKSAPRWRDVLARLTPYPVDGNGFMIGADIPFAKSHRHYSHLLAVYPLYEVTGRTPEERALIERSLAHWVGFEGALQGYTFTGAASMSALLGKGEDALNYLGELMTRFIQPNTMYQESGPVIETPLSAAQSLHDMVCQSWGGVIRVFPALPAAWQDLTVHRFRTQGAFLLSAVRRGGITRWVRLVSEAGAPCVVRHGIAGPIEVRDGHGRPLRHEDAGDGAVRIALRKGESALVTARGDRPDLSVAPVRPNADAPRWGLPRA
ncbi:glycosyl hydrolase family 95 catalytic domain-containing protein [Streptomyces griseorubiginosus]|uniref:glycosyl hydrolase family 95 catalytic domain-containing protein n=1 Tax=Streptomyces griseorubiginosus TaxID=67304 RepID=UPI002E7FDC68|nr:Tat pathway signal sequence domain protein [Streptomyces griseorubiginosus]WUB49485.1 Tat pathway signal sequence domain protein [Streptomyces griseorubiginosus]WUB58014.1 Tat pathway signal sequence domain protein [Streptomyces griseorubiginosus]